MSATHQIQPPSDDGTRRLGARERADADVGEPADGLTLKISRNTDPLVVMNFVSDLPTASTVKDRTALVKAGQSSEANLDEDAWHAVARAMVDPATATAMLRNDLFIEETAENTTLLSVPARVLLTEVFPLIQPRSGATAGSVTHPEVAGVLADDGKPTAALAFRFEDKDHLARYLRQTVAQTRVLGRKYDESILSRRISRPILVHPARIDFEDGAESVWVVVVRDGITRVVSSWAARFDQDTTPEQLAEHVEAVMLSTKPTRAARTETQQHARGREEHAEQDRASFTAGMTGGTPNETAIRIGQTFAMPAQVYVGVDMDEQAPLPSTEIFDDAQRAVVASIHVDFKGWDEAAGQVEVIDRAMHRVAHLDRLDADVVDLATGVVGVRRTSAVFDIGNIPNTPLWRAIYLVCFLCSPPAYIALKRELRSLLGLRRIENKRFVGHLAPVVDLPWRATKGRTLKQARRAWSNGGPIPDELLGVDWWPVPTKDFTKLVPKALKGDRNARFTLMVAGGIALTADKLITSNIGSALAEGRVPFRADAQTIVTGLGKTEAGLWMLARAANVFDASKSAINSFTPSELAAEPTLAAACYRIPKIKTDAPSEIEKDNAGIAVPVTEGEIVRLSDPARAQKAEEERKGRRNGGRPREPQRTPSERAADLRHRIRTGLVAVEDDLKAVVQLAPDISGHPLGTEDLWLELQMTLGSIQSMIFSNRPPHEQEPAAYTDADSDAEEDDEDEPLYGDEVYGNAEDES